MLATCARRRTGHSPRSRRWDRRRAFALQAREVPEEKGVLVVVRDRTDEMRREFAERDFISNAAHELRNPLAGISGAIEVLQDGAKDDPEARDHFLAPPRRGLRADEPPDPVAARPWPASSRSGPRGGGRRRARRRPRRVAACRQDAGDRMVSRSRSKGPDREGDPTLLRQVLIGLLGNASSTPRPRLGAASRAAREGRGEVVLEVIDTGSGIPAAETRTGLRALLPAPRSEKAGRLRPRPRDRSPDGRRDGRADRRDIDRGQGKHVLGSAPAREAEPDPGGMRGQIDR